MKFLKEEELLEKKKRKWKNGLSITPFVIHKNAGDVEAGINHFNSAMTTGSCTGACEALERGDQEKANEIEKEIQWYEEKEDDQPYNAGKYQTEISNLKQELKEDTVEKPNKPANKEAIIEFPINIEEDDIDRFLDLAKDYNLVKTHLEVNRFGGAHKYDLYFRGKAIDIFNFVKFVAEDEDTFFYDNFEEFVDDVWDTYPELFEENLKENKMEFKHLHEAVEEEKVIVHLLPDDAQESYSYSYWDWLLDDDGLYGKDGKNGLVIMADDGRIYRNYTQYSNEEIEGEEYDSIEDALTKLTGKEYEEYGSFYYPKGEFSDEWLKTLDDAANGNLDIYEIQNNDDYRYETIINSTVPVYHSLNGTAKEQIADLIGVKPENIIIKKPVQRWDYEEEIDESLKEDLNNVTEVEDKAKEVMDPTFASAVREIRSHDKGREELKKVRNAPKEGEEVLPKDLKMNLEESLFTEWVEKEEEVYTVYIVHSDIDENNIKREFNNKEEAIEYAKENAVEETWVDEVTVDPKTSDEYVDTIWVYDEDEIEGE